MKGILLLLVLFLLACSNPNQQPQNQQNNKNLTIITPDWAIASSLVGIGNPPIATGDLKTLPDWSVSPAMPIGTIDLGARFAPNPELMAQLSADLFIYSEFYSHLNSVKSMPNWEYNGVNRKGATPTWTDYEQAILTLGKKINQEQQAIHYIDRTKAHLKQQGQLFRQIHPNIQKISVIQIPNTTQFYNYTHTTPFGMTTDMMGLTIADFGKPNDWGSYIGQMSEITQLDKDVCLVIVKPFSPMLKKELNKNPLWKKLGYATGERCAMVIEPVWAYGDLASMTGFADSLVNAIPYTEFGQSSNTKSRSNP